LHNAVGLDFNSFYVKMILLAKSKKQSLDLLYYWSYLAPMKKLNAIYLVPLISLSCNAAPTSPSALSNQKVTTNQVSNDISTTGASPSYSKALNDPEASFKAFCAALPSWVTLDSNKTFSIKLRKTDNVYPGGGDGTQTEEAIFGNCTPGKMSISVGGSVATPLNPAGWRSNTVNLNFISPLNTADTAVSTFSYAEGSSDFRIESSGTVSNVVILTDHSKGSDVTIEFDYQVTQMLEDSSRGFEYKQMFTAQVEADIDFPHSPGDNIGSLSTQSPTEAYRY
jgi:hypothetical protein